MVMCIKLAFKAGQIAKASNIFKTLHRSGVNTTTLKCLRTFSSSRFLAGERKYSDKHEWVAVDGSIGTVGISHYAQDALGDVVYAQLPDIGSNISRDDECGALESVKAASELYSPLSGKVIEKNEAVEEMPALINQSCYEKGWLFKLEITDPKELERLMSESEYEKFLKVDHS